jgi:hypothetical protein
VNRSYFIPLKIQILKEEDEVILQYSIRSMIFLFFLCFIFHWLLFISLHNTSLQKKNGEKKTMHCNTHQWTSRDIILLFEYCLKEKDSTNKNDTHSHLSNLILNRYTKHNEYSSYCLKWYIKQIYDYYRTEQNILNSLELFFLHIHLISLIENDSKNENNDHN